MKRLLMISSAIGLCLAAPAFAQTAPNQDQMNAPRATSPNASAPPANQTAPRQPQSATQQQKPASGLAFIECSGPCLFQPVAIRDRQPEPERPGAEPAAACFPVERPGAGVIQSAAIRDRQSDTRAARRRTSGTRRLRQCCHQRSDTREQAAALFHRRPEPAGAKGTGAKPSIAAEYAASVRGDGCVVRPYLLPRKKINFEGAELDGWSLFLLAAALACLEIGLKQSPQDGWFSSICISLFSLSGPTGGLCVRRTLRAAHPMSTYNIQGSFFRNRVRVELLPGCRSIRLCVSHAGFSSVRPGTRCTGNRFDHAGYRRRSTCDRANGSCA